MSKEYFSKIVENWEHFPFKVDYIIHILCSLENCDVNFKKENDVYKICYPSNKDFENNNFTISVSELFNYFQIENFADRNYLQFAYETQIFTQSASFRCQKIKEGDELISMRLVSQNSNFNEFSEKLTKYFLFFQLNEKLPEKQKVSEIKKKI